jgi:FXSXX-COOH protein
MRDEIIQASQVEVDGGIETDLVDLGGIHLADVARLRGDALGDALRRIVDHPDEPVASFQNSI